MPQAIIHVPLHLKDSVERYIALLQQRESAFFQLKYRTVYSLTCAFCRKTVELSHVTEQEAQEILIERGWQKLLTGAWKLKPACPACVEKMRSHLKL